MQGDGHARAVAAPQAGHDHADQTSVCGLQIIRADAEQGFAGRGVGRGAPVVRHDLAARHRGLKLQAFAKKVVDEGRGGAVIEGLGRIHLFDLALTQDGDAVGQFQRLFLIVGDEDGRHAGLLMHLTQPAAQVASDAGVQGAEGLVQQQQSGLDGQGAGQGDALALAAGQLAGIAAAITLQLDQAQQVVDALGDLGAAGT